MQRLKQGEAVAGDETEAPARRRARGPRRAPAPHEDASDYGIEVKGVDDVMVRLAKCCRPVPGDEIVGYVSLGRGITIHREDCKNVAALKKAPERFTDVSWDGDNSTSYRVELQVDAWDRTRLLEDLSRTFSEAGVNILEANCTTKHPMVKNRFVVEVGDTEQLKQCIGRLRNVESVFDAYRVTPDGVVARWPGAPAVSVVVPFARRRGQLAALARSGGSRNGAGDELIVADNSGGEAALRSADWRRSCPPTGERSSYHARNAGAARGHAASGSCSSTPTARPRPGLLDAYFARAARATGRGRRRRDPRRAGSGRPGGPLRARPQGAAARPTAFTGAVARSRATGNLMVRRAAFEELGGFVEGIRSAGDVDFCLRLQAAGWKLDVPRPRPSFATAIARP